MLFLLNHCAAFTVEAQYFVSLYNYLQKTQSIASLREFIAKKIPLVKNEGDK
jgi:hypothetical protein